MSRGSGKEKGRCGRSFGSFLFSFSINASLLPPPSASNPRPCPPETGAHVPHSATSASVPMEKSLIEGEAGNDEPDLGVDVADDAKPVAAFAVSLLPPPSAVADERCDSRRMSEDIVL